MYIEGICLSAIGRVLGYSAPAVLGWVKKGQHTLSRLRERTAQRTEGVAGQQSAAMVACDELWTYRGVRREIWWIWVVAAEKDGRRWVDLTVATAAKILSCGCMTDCRRRRCIAATAMRCTAGFSRIGTARAKVGR